jgi:hypothetical protein
MNIEHKENQTVIKDTHDNIASFSEDLLNELTDFKDQNLIIDLTHNSNITSTSIKQFVQISKLHKKNNKSFVIVANTIDYNSVPVSLTLVPTILEAHDIINMEEIERDLGF